MPLVKCKICGKNFYAKPSWIKRGWGKYCSNNCRKKAQLKGKFVHCDICKKKIWKSPKEIRHSKSGKFFCSKTHQTQWRNNFYSGVKHPLWKGGNHQSYRKFLRKKVAPKCKLCGNDDESILVVHHKDKKRNNNAIKNLVWLCLNCHHLVHYCKKRV